MIVHSNVDLRKIKETVIFGLTKRQCKFFGIGIVLAALSYYLTYKYIGGDISIFILIFVAAPFFIIGIYESPDGRYLEDVIKDIWIYKKKPPVRTYQTENTYGYLKDRTYQRDVLKIESAENLQKARKLF